MIAADFNGDFVAGAIIIEYGDVVTLNCTASGGPDNMLHWYKDNILLQENDENILDITSVNAADGGLYECVVNNTAGNSTANVTIHGRSCYHLTHNAHIIVLFSCSTIYQCTTKCRSIH